MKYSKFFPIIAIGMVSTISLNSASLSQQYNLFGSITPTTAYNFGVAQYRLFANDVLSQGDSLYLDYDTDAFLLQTEKSFAKIIRAGLYGKAHIFDYQNMNHLINTSNGKDQPEFTMNAAHIMGGASLGAFSTKGYYLKLGGEIEKTQLSLRDKSDIRLKLSSPGLAHAGTASLGYSNTESIKPWLAKGFYLALNTKYREFTSVYSWEFQNQKIGSASRVISEGELTTGYGTFHDHFGFKLAARAGLQNTALSHAETDLLYAFSLGGPETRYRRIAGFAFSEFRNPAYALINSDFMYNFMGTTHLWMVADILLLDRENAGSKTHAGLGLGLIIDLPRTFLEGYNSLYLRADVAATAGRVSFTDRLQFLFGLTGHF